MFRTKLPRLYELDGLQRSPRPPKAYPFNFGQLDEAPMKHKQLRDIEKVLQTLDNAAWQRLKGKLKRALTQKLDDRGWQPLYDIFSEARAYAYLVCRQCRDVRFIPEGDGRTPDLEAFEDGRKVVCEVKTINPFAEEINLRRKHAVRTVTAILPEKWFQKLRTVLEDAANQIDTYCPDGAAKRLAYVVINFDDELHEYEKLYRDQISACLPTITPANLEVKFDIKPPFYVAMVPPGTQ